MRIFYRFLTKRGIKPPPLRILVIGGKANSEWVWMIMGPRYRPLEQDCMCMIFVCIRTCLLANNDKCLHLCAWIYLSWNRKLLFLSFNLLTLRDAVDDRFQHTHIVLSGMTIGLLSSRAQGLYFDMLYNIGWYLVTTLCAYFISSSHACKKTATA